MIDRSFGAMAILWVALCAPAAASAQSTVSAGVEAATDDNRRGISWSGGRATASADGQVRWNALDASLRLTALRDSPRHAGADGVADLVIGADHDIGAFRLRAEGVAHLFAGAAGRMDYVEAGASASYGYGPLYLTGGALFAPAQAAIGGSNLYLHADASAGVPGTPLTVIATVGHTSGSTRDPVRAQRLRPGGDYSDWRLGVEHRRGPLTLGIDYVGTDIARDRAFGPFADARHAGDRIVGRARIGF